MCLLLMDLDNLKELNDSKGHRAGDESLRRTVDAIRTGLRKSDFFFRIGGDEFAVILPETSRTHTRVIAEKILSRVRMESSESDATTISAGIAEYRNGVGRDSLFEAADKALYQAKVGGKDRVVVSGEQQPGFEASNVVPIGIQDESSGA